MNCKIQRLSSRLQTLRFSRLPFITLILPWFNFLQHQDRLETSTYVSSIRTPMLARGRLEHTEISLMYFKWEVTRTHGNHPNAF